MNHFNTLATAGRFFLIIAEELIVIFIAAAFVIGLLLEYLPPARIKQFLSGKMIGVQYFLGAGLGAITLFCSCSTVPLLAGLLCGGCGGLYRRPDGNHADYFSNGGRNVKEPYE